MSACCHGLCLKTGKQSKTITIHTNFMRRSLLFLPILWAMMLILASCQKDADRKNNNDELISKIYSWLDKQKSANQPNKAANVDLLKENIDFLALKFEHFTNNEQFIVIPIKEKYKIEKHIDKNTPSVLLLVQDKAGSIIRGNIVQYFPENNQPMNSIPDNTFSKMYAEKNLECNGLFRFLSPTGRWLFQREYRNGKMRAFGFVKADNNSEARITTDCTLYFLILTLWVGGVPVAQEAIYLGQVCESNCDDAVNQSLCPDYGNGAGGVSAAPAPETCCIPDPNAQFSHQRTDITRDDCGLEGVDPITGNPTKSCIHSWTFHRWNLLWYNWDFTCFTHTELEKIGGLWKFKTATFRSVARNGQLPPCVSSECTVNAANPSISADRLRTKLNLSYTISNRLICYNWWPPGNVTSTISNDWPPPY